METICLNVKTIKVIQPRMYSRQNGRKSSDKNIKITR